MEPLTGDAGLERAIPSSEVSSPGLVLAGYTARFAPDRVHVLGETEVSYLFSLPAAERRRTLEQLFELGLPCLFVTKSLEVPPELVELGKRYGVAVLRSQLKTSEFYDRLKPFLEVGFNLYADMLDHAVRSLKAGREPDLSQPFEVITEVNLHFPALLPASYCADVHERLVLYKRFANCDSAERVEAMQEELVDRFGDLPGAARALIESHRLRILGRALGVARIDADPEIIQLQFVQHPPLEPAAVLKVVQKNRWKLTGPTKLRVERVTSELPERALTVRQVLEALATAALKRAA